jgi:hypothetical protein
MTIDGPLMKDRGAVVDFPNVDDVVLTNDDDDDDDDDDADVVEECNDGVGRDDEYILGAGTRDGKGRFDDVLLLLLLSFEDIAVGANGGSMSSKKSDGMDASTNGSIDVAAAATVCS